MTMTTAKEALLEVLRETRVLLEQPDNDFNGSSWNGMAAALAEVDGFIAAIEAEHPFDRLKLTILFAPTGNIQEVSASSGWGDEFCRLAERFDQAFEAYEKLRKQG